MCGACAWAMVGLPGRGGGRGGLGLGDVGWGGSHSALAPMRAAAVAYTHLTLPTTLRVYNSLGPPTGKKQKYTNDAVSIRRATFSGELVSHCTQTEVALS